jgi:hypothetical protein
MSVKMRRNAFHPLTWVCVFGTLFWIMLIVEAVLEGH